MNKQSLLWIVPTLVIALAFAYVRTTPKPVDDIDVRYSQTNLESVQQLEQTSDDQIDSTVEAQESVGADGAAAAAAHDAGDCTIVTRFLPQEDGTSVEVFACERVSPKVQHPYASYTNDALESLAYSDAKAAEILGMRLREDDEELALSLTFRASALDGGNADPILAFSNAYPHPSSINNVPVQRTIHKKYVMSAVAEMLGAPLNNLEFWEDQIRQFSPDPDREIAMLRAQARKVVDEMRQVELDVTGTSTIGGQGDA